MKTVYDEIQKKYEDTIKVIIQDTEIECVDFPMVQKPIVVDTFTSMLDKDLADKLNIIEDIYIMPKKEENKDKQDPERGGL